MQVSLAQGRKAARLNSGVRLSNAHFRKLETGTLMRRLPLALIVISLTLLSGCKDAVQADPAKPARNEPRPQQEAPFQARVNILKPIDGSQAFASDFNANEFSSEIVVSFSNPVPEDMVLHFASRVGSTQALHLTTQFFQFDESRKTASSVGTTDLKNEIVAGEEITLWAFLTKRDSTIGATYKDIDALRTSVAGAFISDPVTVGIERMPH